MAGSNGEGRTAWGRRLSEAGGGPTAADLPRESTSFEQACAVVAKGVREGITAGRFPATMKETANRVEALLPDPVRDKSGKPSAASTSHAVAESEPAPTRTAWGRALTKQIGA